MTLQRMMIQNVLPTPGRHLTSAAFVRQQVFYCMPEGVRVTRAREVAGCTVPDDLGYTPHIC